MEQDDQSSSLDKAIMIEVPKATGLIIVDGI